MTTKAPYDFKWQTEQFADIRILRYYVDGFEKLEYNQKCMIWHLYQAALSGRDIVYDQNYKYNLLIRNVLELVYTHIDHNSHTEEAIHFNQYLKQFWFSNGIHHHYSTEKLKPSFSQNWFEVVLHSIPESQLPDFNSLSKKELIDFLSDQLFNPNVSPKRVEQADGTDLVAGSSCNFYENLTQQEVVDFYQSKKNPDPLRPVSWGLNSKLIKENGQIKEVVYKADGRYGKAIRKIVIQLEKAKQYADNDLQKEIITKLIAFYESGDLAIFDAYSIDWVKDTDSMVDFVNGFIEVYGDPLGYHGTWQSVVSIRDVESSNRFSQISALAAWFEKHSPIEEKHKRQDAAGVSYKVINTVVEAGDNAPSSPIGVNLPNADWIRSEFGSKSVSLGNIEEAYEMASKTNGSLEAFFLPDQQKRIKAFGALASKLHTGLHEVIGHGSGQLMAGVGTPKETLQSYSNTIEEARADLVALYFIADPKLIEAGLIDDPETAKAAYDSFMVGGLIRQLVRVEPGKVLEESHMRNRQLIASWVFEKGLEQDIVEKVQLDSKTYLRINDYQALRHLFGILLNEVQRIKSEGDYTAARELVENYGVKIDPLLHQEVLARWKSLGISPFAGFIQPQLELERQDGKIVDVSISYPDDFAAQMLYYSRNYSFLPLIND